MIRIHVTSKGEMGIKSLTDIIYFSFYTAYFSRVKECKFINPKVKYHGLVREVPTRYLLSNYL